MKKISLTPIRLCGKITKGKGTYYDAKMIVTLISMLQTKQSTRQHQDAL